MHLKVIQRMVDPVVSLSLWGYFVLFIEPSIEGNSKEVELMKHTRDETYREMNSSRMNDHSFNVWPRSPIWSLSLRINVLLDESVGILAIKMWNYRSEHQQFHCIEILTHVLHNEGFHNETFPIWSRCWLKNPMRCPFLKMVYWLFVMLRRTHGLVILSDAIRLWRMANDIIHG